MAKHNFKKDLHSQVTDQEVTMLLFGHFSVKMYFFKLELFLVCFTYLISSFQNFVILKYWNFEYWNTHNCMYYFWTCPESIFKVWGSCYCCRNVGLLAKEKNNHWLSYVKKERHSQNSMIIIRRYGKNIKYI